MISTVIIKPTKGCNADCSYCCAPPDGAPKWSIDDFRRVIDSLKGHLQPGATLIWHGGEPMLLGPNFYREAYDIARQACPGIRFSMQSNLLGYNKRWNAVFHDIFQGSISTSWDPEEHERTVKGDPHLYARLFEDRIGQVLSDGWRPKIISTFTEQTIALTHHVYERALERASRGQVHDIRFNYRYPAGRQSGAGVTLTPESYGRNLIEIYDRWISDLPDFVITPLDQMFRRVVGNEVDRCPWAKGCTGKIIGVEPNFDVYNCGEFAELADPEFKFGNLLEDGIEACLKSPAARALSLRRIKHPDSCKGCIHYKECEAGCMRDSVLYGRGLYGKFQYCVSWQEVFSRIKESILTGEADGAVAKLGHNPELIRAKVARELGAGLAEGRHNMRRPWLAAGHFPDHEVV